MGWTPQAQLTRSATRASANSTESTTVSLASLPCAMSKLFERLVLSPHDLMAGLTGLETRSLLHDRQALWPAERRTRIEIRFPTISSRAFRCSLSQSVMRPSPHQSGSLSNLALLMDSKR